MMTGLSSTTGLPLHIAGTISVTMIISSSDTPIFQPDKNRGACAPQLTLSTFSRAVNCGYPHFPSIF